MEKLSSKKFEIFDLSWDTEYFGIPSAKVILNDSLSESEKHTIIEYAKNFEFVTITNKGNNTKNNLWIGTATTAFLTDMNIQFVKEIKETKDCVLDAEISEFKGYDENLRIMSENAYEYSRFFNDPFLPEKQAKQIYVKWLDSSFGKQGKYFSVVAINHKAVGYVLFSINHAEKFAVIELIAVDNEYQGKKIGVSLLSSMENFLHSKDIDIIKVGTQIENKKAIGFYQNVGFKYSECNSIYHYWPNKQF